jgi:hypothetical protein
MVCFCEISLHINSSTSSASFSSSHLLNHSQVAPLGPSHQRLSADAQNYRQLIYPDNQAFRAGICEIYSIFKNELHLLGRKSRVLCVHQAPGQIFSNSSTIVETRHPLLVFLVIPLLFRFDCFEIIGLWGAHGTHSQGLERPNPRLQSNICGDFPHRCEYCIW